MDPIKVINLATGETTVSNEPAENTSFQHTMIAPQAIATETSSIVSYLKAPTTFSIEDGASVQTATQQGVAEQAQKYPIIVIINGAGGNGKDTFIEAAGKKCAAMNISSITEVKNACETLINSVEQYNSTTWSINPKDEMLQKSDAYRSFLHDVKTAWIKFCNGPAESMYSEIRRTIDAQIHGMEAYDVIFLHIREVDEIAKVRDYLIQQMGLIVLTVLVRGWVAASNYTNSGDADVENFTYDMTISNRSTLDMWEIQANMFAERISQANALYGIISPIITSTPSTASTTQEPEQPSTVTKVEDIATSTTQTQTTTEVTAQNGTDNQYYGTAGFRSDYGSTDPTGAQ